MRILFVSRRPAYPFFQGGAELSFFELARALAEGGHWAAIFGECRESPATLDAYLPEPGTVDEGWYDDRTTFRDRQVPSRLILVSKPTERLESLNTFLADFRRQLGEIIYELAPDVICTQLEGSAEVVELCASGDAHLLHFVRDTCNPFNFHVLADVPGNSTKPTCVANSHYTAGFVRSELGVESHVLYPIVRGMEPEDGDPSDGADSGRRPSEGRGGGRVLFVNPNPLKGGDVMLDVVRRLSEVRFLLLPGWAEDIPDAWQRLANVECRQWPVLDMGAAYRSVDLVVVPTQHSEGFGRVAIEAQLCGTPVMASNHSALAEVLADSALLIDDYRDPEAWVDAIRSVLSAPPRLHRLAEAGRVNSARFGPESIREAFESLVRELDAGRG